MTPTVNGVTLTADTISRARDEFARIAEDCIQEVRSGGLKVSDPDAYIESELRRIDELRAGRWDHTVTFLQRAYWLQTGECPPILAPPRP